MGNRAVIIPKASLENAIGPVAGIYVHWFDSGAVEEALRTMEERGYRSMDDDPSYGLARLCMVLCEQSPLGNNIGIETVDLDAGDCCLDAGIVAVDGMGLYHVVPVGDGFDLEPMVDE